jgi:hypothetical protein
MNAETKRLKKHFKRNSKPTEGLKQYALTLATSDKKKSSVASSLAKGWISRKKLRQSV